MLESLTKEVYVFDEVAELLGVNVNTLYRWRKEGRITAYRLADGQKLRVRREEVARLLGRSDPAGVEGVWHDARGT
jgi:excisionase family DNA binding protein